MTTAFRLPHANPQRTRASDHAAHRPPRRRPRVSPRTSALLPPGLASPSPDVPPCLIPPPLSALHLLLALRLLPLHPLPQLRHMRRQPLMSIGRLEVRGPLEPLLLLRPLVVLRLLSAHHRCQEPRGLHGQSVSVIPWLHIEVLSLTHPPQHNVRMRVGGVIVIRRQPVEGSVQIPLDLLHEM